jgi:C-terminal processing protease CtpA/Prc
MPSDVRQKGTLARMTRVLFLLGAGCGAGSWDGGIHARMGWSADEGLRVIEVPEGPAREAGLEVEDRILAIDGVPIADMGRDEVVARLRGPVGSRVELTVRRGDEELDIGLDRAPYAGD